MYSLYHRNMSLQKMTGYTAAYISHLRRDSWSLICSIHFPSFPHHFPIIFPSCPHHSPRTLRHFVSHPSHQLCCEATWAPGCGTRCWLVSRTEKGRRVISKNCFGMFGKCFFFWIPFCPDESVYIIILYIYIYLCVCRMIMNHHRRVYLFHWHWKHQEIIGDVGVPWVELTEVQRWNMFKKEIMWPASNSQQKSAEQKLVKDGAIAASCKREWTQRLRKMRIS